MKILIKVTKDVLRRSMWCSVNGDGHCETEEKFLAKQGLGFNCAIGLAVNDLLPNAWTSINSIHIFPSFKHMQELGASHVIYLPEIAFNFINEFDSLKTTPEERLNMPEISFEIDLPSDLIDQIGIGQAYKVLSESKTLELVSI